ncbi:UDP-N-acetyl-D-mannosamine dehydrogenase [Actinobacillus indolicus]|nr:UDP-N-acetyl-D-mannosamine dehydrogenase [Actinobacillus indolicus]VTU06801.1 UDP-N-acetyl-D-mannosamine dehydrogenase [Actinobacillus indolicus]
MPQFNHISVIGLGYIGLPTAVAFAQTGVKVTGIDINPDVVARVNQGQLHILEPGLEIALKQSVEQNLLTAQITPDAADVFLIAVPTPFNHHTQQADLTYIESASRAIAPVLAKGNLIILESTVPVGTTEYFANKLAEARPDLTFPQQVGDNSDIRIAYCPERVLPGKILQEIVDNDRIIGGMTSRCSEQAVKLYKKFVKGECFVANSRTAEMCKLTENAFRDVNIAFANEISMICDELDINVWELITLANRHPRVNILQAGCGVGGHCIAVDPWFIVSKSPETAKLIKTARDVNDSKSEWVINKVNQAVIDHLKANPTKSIQKIKIGCLGLAFKADIDDLRESPALKITQQLATTYPNQIWVVEPNIQHLPEELKENAQLADLESILEEMDILVILIDHKPFKDIDWKKIEKAILIDTKGISSLNR